jgi:hypothetical protein
VFLCDEVCGDLNNFLENVRVGEERWSGEFEILGKGAGGFGNGSTVMELLV